MAADKKCVGLLKILTYKDKKTEMRDKIIDYEKQRHTMQ